AGRTFIAGADITEFGRPPVEPHLPDVILALEAATRPWIAAIHGTAFGGGLEVALGCHYRIAARDARLGLPEVTLGLIPGAGGTVRLPRLIAPAEALTMVAEGRPLPASRALELGLLDAIAEGELLPAALRFAAEATGRALPAPLVRRPPAGGTDGAFGAAAARILAKARGQAAPAEAVAALRDALALPATEALAAERRRFVALRDGPQSRALRYLFAAERAVPKIPGLTSAAPLPTAAIGVIGGGTMGAGIATSALLAGRSVVMIERDDAALARGLGTARGHLADSLKRGIVDEARHATMLTRLTGATDFSALAGCDLVIEAVFEDMGAKQAVFAELDRVTRPQAILATNTSYLDVNAIAAAVGDPGRVAGLHFFSPAHVMKLVEVIRTESVRDEVLATALAFARDLGKIAVPSGVCDGFIGNRIMSAYRRECDYMIEDGALPQEIDAAMTGFGYAMGIFAMQDLAGLDIAWAMRKRRAATRPPAERYVAIADRLCEMGRLGRKTGAGWYDYAEGSRTGTPSALTERIILEESARHGISRRRFTAEEIMARILAVMQAEGCAILAEGIAASPDAIDVVMVNGYGFPRWQGGPMWLAKDASASG
ncbi:MAG TPA: 3-hydroxyacyl-CoA dehydrogenase NAD-binding domain-containing protein, partial [Paracoccaceae bacterium]|nr:3-hydroxyacyl-CoA dehydrogenase NAD-binding domain-containing protein [Paracoccaceae bacterium]